MKNKKVGVVKIILVFLIIILIFLLACKYIYIYENVEFKLKGKDEINIEVKSHYEEPGFIAKVNKKDKSKSVKIKSNIDENKLGEYEVQYLLKIKMIGTRKIVRKVNVVDTTAPYLNIDSSDDVTIVVGDTYEMPAYEAIDNVDGDITDKVQVDSSLDTSTEGVYDIVYTVVDSSKNKSTKKITVTVENKFKSTYIDVSIANQTLNYYVRGELKLTSPIVTGINNGTPTGDYEVLYKTRDVNLTGADYVSHVDYWIAFIGHSYGFHDASWRSSFGGTIYKYNGSHGCINMPKNKVAELYNLVEVGTPVYIK
jgi:lipoprotein-anchoring transpeptidase ErfK/SrfK